jgi:peptidyl-prolyl cis-trans isomerase C
LLCPPLTAGDEQGDFSQNTAVKHIGVGPNISPHTKTGRLARQQPEWSFGKHGKGAYATREHNSWVRRTPMQAKKATFFSTLVIATTLIGFSSPVLALDTQSTENKVAVVNGTVITEKELDRQVSFLEMKLQEAGKPVNGADLAEIKRDALENLIDEELLYQAAVKQKSKVSDAEINHALSTIKARFPNENEFRNALSKAGLSEAALKSQVDRNLTIEQFIDKQFIQKLNTSEMDAKAYYNAHPDLFKRAEQVRASHILIRVNPQADQSQKEISRKKIETIEQRLKNGEDFAELARQNSEDPSSARGGDLGYFGRGRMVKPFEDAAFALKPGEISGVVETQFGYHLIKVTDRKPETVIPYEEVKDKLQEYLKREKIREQVGSFVAEQKGKAKVERLLTEKP